MKFVVTFFCMLGFVLPAAAQTGISSARDRSGNLIRDNGANSPKPREPGPINGVQSPNRSGSTRQPDTTGTAGQK